MCHRSRPTEHRRSVIRPPGLPRPAGDRHGRVLADAGGGTLADLGGPSNFIHLHPTLDLFFSEKLRAMLDWGFFWRESVDDAVYSIGTLPTRDERIGRQRYSGSTPAVTVVWEPTRHLTLLAGYVHFIPGPFFQAPPAFKAVDYFTSWAAYKF